MTEFILVGLAVSALIVGSAFLVAQVMSNASRIKMLEKQVAGLRTLLESLDRAVEQRRPGQAPEPARPVSPSAAIPQAGRREEPSPPPARVPSAPAAPAPPPRKPSRSREEWEALIGGKLLNRIGALALILAVGFFLKYAFDKDWITEIARVGIGALAGLVCLVLAERTTRRGFQVFAQGLVGAGIAILYVTVYASFNFYALV